ncbi:hypothetical protein ERICIII_04816 (plasmid) [Paenibacillus larvae subsp. larvae]|uniref:Uncharacterized protein n=1 Tax=Paenibacillus larvae subsp. larvae TaxID=147375 RepID=A0A2L1U7C0_9BACL|nr:hypothetical protein ERICIII_04816 [Paenibacillus larvae subsp. larvae]
MSEKKAAILLVVISLVIFGFLVGFSSETIPVLLKKIGSGLLNMVDSVFRGIDTSQAPKS